MEKTTGSLVHRPTGVNPLPFSVQKERSEVFYKGGGREEGRKERRMGEGRKEGYLN